MVLRWSKYSWKYLIGMSYPIRRDHQTSLPMITYLFEAAETNLYSYILFYIMRKIEFERINICYRSSKARKICRKMVTYIPSASFPVLNFENHLPNIPLHPKLTSVDPWRQIYQNSLASCSPFTYSTILIAFISTVIATCVRAWVCQVV